MAGHEFAKQAPALFLKPGEQSLVNTILQRLLDSPSATCLIFKSQSYSNLWVAHRTLKLADQLALNGITAGIPVGVCIHRSPDTLVILLAIWCLRAIYVPLDPSHPIQRLEHVVADAGLQHIACDENTVEKLHACPARLFNLQISTQFPDTVESNLKHHSREAIENDQAYYLYTSGSSGKPKGVIISQKNIFNLLTTMQAMLNLTPGLNFLGLSSFCFDIAFFELLMPLLTHGTIVLADDVEYKDPLEIKKLINSHLIDVIQATPSFWKLLLQAKPGAEHPFTLAISTGESLSQQTALQIQSYTKDLWNLYGPTETTLWATAYQVKNKFKVDQAGNVAIGKPLPGYACELTCPQKHSTNTADKNSELIILGNGVSQGYLHDTALTHKQFGCNDKGDKYYRSGDLCWCDADGDYYCIGRMDQQIKIYGNRIELVEIEHALEQHPAISQAACVTLPILQHLDSCLVACIVYTPGMPNKTVDQLNEFLRQSLPEYMLPARYQFMITLPLTANGKLDKHTLKRMVSSNFKKERTINADSSHPANFVNTGTQSAGVIKNIFCDLLETDTVGYYDSFFDLGGNSMLCATLLMMINDNFHLNLSLREILQTPPTIASINARVKAALHLKANPQSGTQFPQEY